MMEKVLKWFKESSGTVVAWMKKHCCTSRGQDNNEIIKKHLPKVKAKIKMCVSNTKNKGLIKEMKVMKARLELVESELKEYEIY